MVGAVDLVKGIGRCAGMEVVDVPGATGDIDTDYAAKARAALAVLPHVDLVFVHVEAPDEAGHRGSVEEKMRAIERVDAEVLAPLVAAAAGPAIMVMPDHYTPVSLRTHVDPPVPFVFAGGHGSPRAGVRRDGGRRHRPLPGERRRPDGPVPGRDQLRVRRLPVQRPPGGRSAGSTHTLLNETQ